MQRLFSVFPNSLPGAGLLLLRLCDGLLLLAHGAILSGFKMSLEGLAQLVAGRRQSDSGRFGHANRRRSRRGDCTLHRCPHRDSHRAGNNRGESRLAGSRSVVDRRPSLR